MQGQARATKSGRKSSIVLAYVVQPGDTLSGIEDALASSMEDITAGTHPQPLSHLPRHDAGHAQHPRHTGAPKGRKEKMAQDEKLAAELVALLEETRPSMQGVQRMEEARESRALRPRRWLKTALGSLSTALPPPELDVIDQSKEEQYWKQRRSFLKLLWGREWCHALT
jgi:hypothetical protein